MKKYSKILRKQNARISIIKPFSLVPVLTNCLLLNELAWRLTPLSDEFSSPELFFNFFILHNHWNAKTVQFIDIMKNWIENLKLKKYFKQGFSISAYSSYSNSFLPNSTFFRFLTQLFESNLNWSSNSFNVLVYVLVLIEDLFYISVDKY